MTQVLFGLFLVLQTAGLPAGKWIDLTHSFSGKTIYWPTAERFELQVVSREYTEKGYFYAANNFRAAEHGGTHLDAPNHFADGRYTTDQIPLEKLIGSAVVVDVTDRVKADRDYRVEVADFESFEAAHGRIPGGAIVLVRTGHSRHWPDPEKYLGTAKRGDAALPELHFPGLHPNLARWLVRERSIKAIGLDTPSLDYGQSQDFKTHQILFKENIPAFENVAHLDQLPATGAFVIALPMKIEEGSGAPLRIVALIPE